MATVCILGGTGFVGRRLATRLARGDHELRVLTRARFRHTDMLLIPGLTLMQADVHDPEKLAAAFADCDAVVNLVGILNERGHRGAGFRRAHTELACKVAAACREAGVRRLLHMGALNAAPDAPSHYLRSKGEGIASVLAAKDLEVTVFDPSVIFGPGDSFLNRFAVLLRRVPLLFPLAFSVARFSPVYVGDVAEAFALCLERRAGIGRRLALCGPRVYTLRELVDYTARLVGVRRLILGLPRWAAWLQAACMEWLPGKPFSLDNYRSLTLDSVCSENALPGLGIAPTPLESVAPLYLGVPARRHVR